MTFPAALFLGCSMALISIMSALAQTGQPRGNPERPVTSPSQIDPGQLNILPSAGISKESAAPTMVFECGKRPEECTKPASPDDKTSTPAPSQRPY